MQFDWSANSLSKAPNAYKEYELPGGQTNCAWVQELNKYCKEQIPNANTIRRLPDIYIYMYKYIQNVYLLRYYAYRGLCTKSTLPDIKQFYKPSGTLAYC